MFEIIKAKAALFAIVAASALAFAAGFALQGTIKNGEIARINLAHQTAVAEAEAARNVALESARATEQKAASDLAALTAKYIEDRQHENAVTQRRIADLASGNERLRVAIEANTSNGSLPGPATSTAGSDGQATATISRAVASRFAQRYADYNEIVDQLTLCQSVIENDRKNFGAVVSGKDSSQH
jgi:hypothetical protein